MKKSLTYSADGQSFSYDDAVALSYASTKFMAKLFMPDHFDGPWTPLHDKLTATIDDPALRKICVMGARGLGKTSIVSLALAGRAIMHRLAHFIVYISNSGTTAIQKMENLKRELLTNPLIKLEGDVRPVKAEGMSEQFTKTGWVANETFVLPLGAGMQVRGLLYGKYRPDLVIIDDLEDLKECGNENIRQQLWEWLRGDVEDMVSPFHKNWKLVYIDTVKHQACIPLRLEKLPDWHAIKLPLCNAKHESLAPEIKTTEELAVEIESARAGGTLDVFYRERMCTPIAAETAAFRQEYFKPYDETDFDFRKRQNLLHNVVLVDPARSVKASSAETAIVGVGVDFERGPIYVRDVEHGHFQPDEWFSKAIEMAKSINARVLAVEETGNEGVIYMLENEVRKLRCGLRVERMKARRGVLEKGKLERIRGLIPCYRKGRMYHNPTCCAALEGQLLSFPYSERLDIMDALAYIVEILDRGRRFFSLPPTPGESDWSTRPMQAITGSCPEWGLRAVI